MYEFASRLRPNLFYLAYQPSTHRYTKPTEKKSGVGMDRVALFCQKTKVDSWPCQCGAECVTLLRTRYHKCKRACLSEQRTGEDQQRRADTPGAPACSFFSWSCECQNNCWVDFCHEADGLRYRCRDKYQERVASYRARPPLVVGRWDAGDEINLLLDDHTQCTRSSLLDWDLEDVEFGPDVYTDLGETVAYYIPYRHYAQYVETGEVSEGELRDTLEYQKNFMASNVAEEILGSSSDEEDLDIDARYLPKSVAAQLGLKTSGRSVAQNKSKGGRTSGYARLAAPSEDGNCREWMRPRERNGSLSKTHKQLEHTISKLQAVDLDDNDSDEENPRYCQADMNLTARQFVKKYGRARKGDETKSKALGVSLPLASYTKPASWYK